MYIIPYMTLVVKFILFMVKPPAGSLFFYALFSELVAEDYPEIKL